MSLGEFSLTKLQNEIDESDTVSLPSSKSDDDMVARGKPAVVLGYKTTNGVKEPCVMLGLIAHRDMDTIDDLLNPDYAKKVVNEHNTTRLRTMGVKSVRFNLVEEIIPPRPPHLRSLLQAKTDHNGVKRNYPRQAYLRSQQKPAVCWLAEQRG